MKSCRLHIFEGFMEYGYLSREREYGWMEGWRCDSDLDGDKDENDGSLLWLYEWWMMDDGWSREVVYTDWKIR